MVAKNTLTLSNILKQKTFKKRASEIKTPEIFSGVLFNINKLGNLFFNYSFKENSLVAVNYPHQIGARDQL